MGEQKTALILLVILCFAGISISEISIVKAEGTIYIRADGSVEGTDKIQRNGNVYTFLGNISIDGSGVDGIIVERDNIVIDGADYALQLICGYYILISVFNSKGLLATLFLEISFILSVSK
jgi:hypothetical protein